jgi:sulfatase modifying factor 1
MLAVLVIWAVLPTTSHAAAEALAADYPVPVGAAFRDLAWSPELIVLPRGGFTMGSTEAETMREARAPEVAGWERPRHRVEVTSPLAVGKFPVTRADFRRFVAATRRALPGGCTVMTDGKWVQDDGKSYEDAGFSGGDRLPAMCVTWQDAKEYAAWLSEQTGHRYRLPREAEYEYAVRGGTTTARWWGDSAAGQCLHANGADISFDKVAPGDPKTDTSCDDGFPYANPVGAFPPNPFGLYDMLGNVWEWTADCFRDSYADAPADASAPVESGDCADRVIRGGSWHNYSNVLRSANRFRLPVGMRSGSLGFRIVRLPD